MSSLRDKCGVKQTETIRGAVGSIIENLQWRMKNPGAIKGISSGFRRLNLTLDGLQPGAMIVIAARPGVGKTAALVNILTNICLEGTPVGMFSLEMPKAQLLERILYGMAGINSDACPRHPDLGDGFHRQQRKRPDFHHGHFPLGQARAEEGCQQEEQIKQRKEP